MAHQDPPKIDKSEPNGDPKEERNNPILPTHQNNDVKPNENTEGTANNTRKGQEFQKSWLKSKYEITFNWFHSHWFGIHVKEHPSDWVQVILATAQVVLAGAIVYFTATSGSQMNELIQAAKTNAEAAKSFAGSAAEIRHDIGKAERDLEKMGSSAEESIRETRRAFQIEQRAWVGFSGIGGKPELGKPYTITVQFGNTGRTPAIGIRSQIMSVPMPKGQEPNFTYADPPESQAVLQPNGQFTVSWKATKLGEVFNQTTLDTLKTGTVRLYVYGHVSYDDVFGGQHWTRFCLHLRGDMEGYTHCKKYNEIDRN